MASRRHIKVVRTTVYPIPKQVRRKRIPKQITVYRADTYNNSRVNLFNADHSYSEHDAWDKRPPTRGWTAGRIHQSRTDRQTDGRAMSWQYWGQPVPRARERLTTNLFSPLRNRFPGRQLHTMHMLPKRNTTLFVLTSWSFVRSEAPSIDSTEVIDRARRSRFSTIEGTGTVSRKSDRAEIYLRLVGQLSPLTHWLPSLCFRLG